MNDMSVPNNHNYQSYFQPAADQQMMNNMPMQNMNNMNMPQVNCRGNNQNNWNNTQSGNWNNNQMMPRRNHNDGMLHFNTLPSVMSSNPNSQSSMSNVSSGTPSGMISFQPESLTNSDFLPAYLKQFIGKWIRADFLIGDSIEQRVGILEDVGASYIILNAIEPATLVVCDLFSIKFVTIVLDDSEYPKLLLV